MNRNIHIYTFLLLYRPPQLLPHLDHSVGIELAVFEQVVARGGLFVEGQILDEREKLHRLAAVMYALKIVIIEARIVGVNGGQDALDRERAAHRSIVIA